MLSLKLWRKLSRPAFGKTKAYYYRAKCELLSTSYCPVQRCCACSKDTFCPQRFSLHDGFCGSSVIVCLRRLCNIPSAAPQPVLINQYSGDDKNVKIQTALQNLDLDVQRMNRIQMADVENVLQAISVEGFVYEDGLDPGVALLQCCGDLMPDVIPASRVKLAHKIWDTLLLLGFKYGAPHFNALLACYVANKHHVTTTDFLAKMGNVTPNEETFNSMLWCACEASDLDQATEVIARMKERGFSLSESMFNALIYGHALSGDVASALSVLETMKTALLPPSSATYTAFLRGLAEVGDLANLLKTYQQAVNASAALSESQLLAVLKSVTVSGNDKLIPTVLLWLPEVSAENSNSLIHTLITLVHVGREAAVLLLIDKLPRDEATPFGKFLIKEMLLANWPVTSIVKVCDKLSSDERNPLALSQAAQVSLQLSKSETALGLLEAMKEHQSELRAHYFWPIILAESRTRGEEGVFSVLRHMLDLGVSACGDTVAGYVLPRVSLLVPAVLVRKLQDSGLGLADVLSPLMGALLNQGQVDGASQLCKTYKARLDCDKLLRPLVCAYLRGAAVEPTVMLVSAMVNGSTQEDDWPGRFILEIITNKKPKAEPHQLQDIITAMGIAGLRCSSFAGEVVTQHISRMPATVDTKPVLAALDVMVDPGVTVMPTELFTHYMPHPRDMGLEELECHLVELKAKNLNTRGVLRRLIQLYSRSGDIQKALQMKQEFEESGHEFTSGMQASLFDLCVQHGRLEEANSCLSKIPQLDPDFSLDEHKIIDFATLLVINNNYDAAVSMIEKRSSAGSVKGGPSLMRNCRHLLNAIADKGEPDLTRRMLELLVRCGYCAVSNILLGPLIRAHIKRKDLAGAVNEFKNSASKYRSTPLQHELLSRLVKVADNRSEVADNKSEAVDELSTVTSATDAADLLQQVLEAGQRVHGSANTHVAFIFALAETGRIKQLQRFLLDRNTKLSWAALERRCRRLVDENKLDALQNLVKSFRGIAQFDLAPIYTLMLQIHCRRGDCEGAIHLWTSMQELDYRPSAEFLLVLADLLQSHKREIPFAVPTTAEMKQ